MYVITKMDALASLYVLLLSLGLASEIIKNNGHVCSGDAIADVTRQATDFIERMEQHDYRGLL